MVDFRITTPQDNVELKFDLNNNVTTNANHVNASTDSILGLAQSTGMVDAMNEINQESSNFDQIIPPLEEETLQTQGTEENAPPINEESSYIQEKKYKKYQEKDARFKELLQQAKQASRERDTYALLLQEKEVELLKKKNEQLERDADYLSSLMQNAKNLDDSEAYVDANKKLTELTYERFKTHESLEQAEQTYKKTYESYEAPVEQNPAYEKATQTLMELSHKKELDSEAYGEWLLENDVYNPYSEDFNPRLASEFAEAKHKFNDYLYAHGQQDMIGTEAYYDELDDLISLENQEKYGTQPYNTSYAQGGGVQSSSYQNQSYYGESDMSQPITRASVAPVNRQGYQNPYAGSNSSLPALTEVEKRIAEICPMTDVPTVRGVQPRYLTNEEKYAIYQQNKAKMMGAGT